MNEVNFIIPLAKDIQAGKAKGRIVTRDGKPARIVCWDAKGDYPIIGLVDVGTSEAPARYTADGKHDMRDNVKSPYDLIIRKGGAA